ncbi:hypothetical protein GMOD_00010035 [Pyrenophora seminiperda CCB06]|uniref:Uncharacterized protein n=1 Tax=Pyrenophora seminiperda CCB06 TaxID=1302712 RepID=A0A3M7M1U0_9PLEO|nr:hypothetical protein GMOD_00010035 [Pyrenophora seminiperda CCB06]
MNKYRNSRNVVWG